MALFVTIDSQNNNRPYIVTIFDNSNHSTLVLDLNKFPWVQLLKEVDNMGDYTGTIMLRNPDLTYLIQASDVVQIANVNYSTPPSVQTVWTDLIKYIFINRVFLSEEEVIELISSGVAGVATFNGRTGNVVLLSSDVTDALGYTPFPQPTGTITQYIRGNGTLALFPTALSQFTNDVGYITASSSDNLTNKTGLISMWTNDVGYLTSGDLGDYYKQGGNSFGALALLGTLDNQVLQLMSNSQAVMNLDATGTTHQVTMWPSITNGVLRVNGSIGVSKDPVRPLDVNGIIRSSYIGTNTAFEIFDTDRVIGSGGAGHIAIMASVIGMIGSTNHPGVSSRFVVRGVTNTSTNYTTIMQNSDVTETFSVRDDGRVHVPFTLEVTSTNGITLGGGVTALNYNANTLQIGIGASWTALNLYVGGVTKYSQSATTTHLTNTTINLGTANVQLAGVGVLKWSSTDLQFGSVDAGFNTLTFFVAGAYVGRWTSAGHLLIGTASDPGPILNVNGQIYASGTASGYILATRGTGDPGFELYSGASRTLSFFDATTSTDIILIKDGKFGVGLSPTAYLHTPLSDGSPNTGAIKLTTGTLLTTTENGVLEYGSSHLYFTIGSTRFQLDQQIAAYGVPIGSSIPGGTAGSVLFINPTGILAQDNANFYWDNTNKWLGIGTSAAPTAALDVAYTNGAGPGVIIRGGGGVGTNIALRLWDTGTGSTNINILEFGHNVTYVATSRIRTTINVANAVTGGNIMFETASNNTGTWNEYQLFLDRGGNVGIGTNIPSALLHVNGNQLLTGSLYIGSATANRAVIYKSVDVNSNVLRFDNPGDTGGYNGGYVFTAGTSGSTSSIPTLRVYSNSSSLPGSVYVGNVTEGAAQQGSTTTTLGVLNRLSAAASNAYDSGLSLNPGSPGNFTAYNITTGKQFGIFIGNNSSNGFGAFGGGATAGVFIGYQYQPSSNGYGSSIVLSAMNETSAAVEIMRLRGTDGHVGLGTTTPPYQLTIKSPIINTGVFAWLNSSNVAIGAGGIWSDGTGFFNLFNAAGTTNVSLSASSTIPSYFLPRIGLGTSTVGTSTQVQIAGLTLITGGTTNPGDGTPAGLALTYETTSYGAGAYISSVHTGVTWAPLFIQSIPGSNGNTAINAAGGLVSIGDPAPQSTNTKVEITHNQAYEIGNVKSQLAVINQTAGGTSGLSFVNTGNSWGVKMWTNPGRGWFEFGTLAGAYHRIYQSAYLLSNVGTLGWSSESNFATDGVGAMDVSINRNAAGVLEINNGTPGTYRDLIVRNLIMTQLIVNQSTGFGVADIKTGIGTGATNEANSVIIRHQAASIGSGQLLQIGVSNVAAGGNNNGFGYINTPYWGASDNNPLLLNTTGGTVGINLTFGIRWPLTVSDTIGIRATTATGNNTIGGKLAFAHPANYGASAHIAGVYDKALAFSGIGMVFATLSGPDISGLDGIERMRISSDGFVGIGTNNPTTILHIVQSTATLQFGSGVSDNTPTLAILRTASSGDVLLNMYNADVGFSVNGSGEFRMRTPAGGWFPTFYSNGSERMRIDTSGNVLVGGTSNNGRKLQVFGNMYVANEIVLASGLIVNNSLLTYIANGGGSAGYVGLGFVNTATPSTTDTVFNIYQSPASAPGNMFNFRHSAADSSGGATPIAIINIATSINQTSGSNGDIRGIYYNPTITALNGRHIAIETVVGDVVFGSFSGNVGIGITSPASKLHIITNSIGASPTDATGVRLMNNTNAAAGAQQFSPSLLWEGRGWKTDATAASQTVQFRTYLQTIQGTANASGKLIFQSSIAGGGYVDNLVIGTDGYVGIGTSSPTTKLQIQAASGNAVDFSLSNVSGVALLGLSTDSGGVSYVTSYYAQTYNIQNSPYIYTWQSAGSTRMTLNDGVLSISGYFASGGVRHNYVTKTSAYTLTDNDFTVDCTTGSFTITLPDATTRLGQIYNVINSGAGTITVDTTSSQTIGNTGSDPTSVNVNPGINLQVQSTGANWRVL